MPKKIIITGGPGSGKTTLIDALIEKGYKCVPEISREVTLNARNNGIDYLYLEDPLYFSKLLLDGRLSQFNEASSIDQEWVFFDRGIPDILAYLKSSEVEIPNEFWSLSKLNAYEQVFLLPPWEEIYTQDSVRYEAYDQACFLYEHLKNMYASLGYALNEVPIGKVSDRIDFILNNLHN